MTYGLAAFILRKWQLVVLMTSLLIVLGVTAFSNIARTEDPQIDGPLFYINAVLPGATPSEVEQLVTKPIEDALYGLSSVRQVRSQSSGSLSATYVEFEWDTDAERTNDAIERELNKLRATLPSELARLDVVRGRPTSAVIAEVALVSDIMPMRRLEKLAERLRERIGGISGINEAKYWGVTSSEMRVSLNAQKLSAIGVAPIEVTQALRRRGGEGPVGEVQGSQRRFNVRYGGAYPDAQSVRDTPVVSQDGGVLRVGDVADVDWQLDSPDHVTRYNGRRAVLITATQNVSANVLPITYELSRTLDQFERTLPGGVSLVRPFFQADNLNHRLDMARFSINKSNRKRDWSIEISPISLKSRGDNPWC